MGRIKQIGKARQKVNITVAIKERGRKGGRRKTVKTTVMSLTTDDVECNSNISANV